MGDLNYPNLELLDPSRAMVVGIATSRVAKGMEEGVVVVPETETAVEGIEKDEKPEKTEKAEKTETPSEE